MKRREFLTVGALIGATAPLATTAAFGNAVTGKQEFYELLTYSLLPGEKKNLINSFLKNAAIPAWNRIGIQPVGVFNGKFGPDRLTLYVLLPHKNLESVINAKNRLLGDKKFLKDGADFLNAEISDPAYMRMESSLLLAFAGMPQLEIPDAVKGKKSRIFELRRYESHSMMAGKKKIEMFNKGGEIAVFKKTGLHPVFFAETVI